MHVLIRGKRQLISEFVYYITTLMLFFLVIMHVLIRDKRQLISELVLKSLKNMTF